MVSFVFGKRPNETEILRVGPGTSNTKGVPKISLSGIDIFYDEWGN